MFDPKSQHFYTLNSSATSTNGNTNNLGTRNISTRFKKPSQNYENYTRANVEDIQFRAQNTDDESDVCSPPLWKSSSYGNLSPNSRTKAIAKGQKELMEMAKNMPESCYELSLRDMVVSPIVDSPKVDDEERCLVSEKNFDRRKSVKEILRQESKKAEKRTERVKSASFETKGLFLKMGFPISMRSKRKNKLSKGTSKRVSPKVETLGKSSEKDWWKKRFSGSSGSDSGVTNTSSGSSKSTSSSDNSHGSSRKSKGWSTGCWSFAFSRRNKRKSN